MLRALILFGFLLGIALCLSPACAAPGDNTVRPLGIGLEGIAYPYPVQFLDLVIEGQALRMAYMDVPRTTPAMAKRPCSFTARASRATTGKTQSVG